MERMTFYLKVKNRNRTAKVENYKAHMFVIAKSVTDTSMYNLVAKMTETISIDPLDEFRTSEGFVQIEYDDKRYSQYGSKYHSYIAFLENEDGETISISGKMSTLKKYHRELAQLEEQALFLVSTSKGLQQRGTNSYSKATY